MKIKRQIYLKFVIPLITLLLVIGISGSDGPLDHGVCDKFPCKRIDELFTTAKLNYGYNYVTRIPKGSMNVMIKQMAISSNLLALKSNDDHFIINGNYRSSEDGIYEYNGDVFDYNKEISLITAEGPLRNPVLVLIFADTLNTGIRYSYIAVSANQSNSFRDIDEYKYFWKLLGFGPCNRSCGPGVQAPIFKCVRTIEEDQKSRFYSPKLCEQLEKPEFSEDIYYCNRGLCPAFWQADNYGICECHEDNPMHNGVSRRLVQCFQEQRTGMIEMVADSNCPSESMPDRNQTCKCLSLNEKKQYIPTGKPKENVRNRMREPYYHYVKSMPLSTPMSLRRFHRHNRSDKGGVWLMSDWTKCDTNYEYRTVYCDRTAPFTDLCDVRLMPDQRRSCIRHEIDYTQGIWLTSSWSNCTGPCSNLKRRRTVVCLRNNILVSNEECDDTHKPMEEENCQRNRSSHLTDNCGPKWHYSEWSECSRSCGNGVQSRYAKCLEFVENSENQLTESAKCRYKTREPVYGMCHLQNCQDILLDDEDGLENSQKSDKNALVTGELQEKLAIASLPDNFYNCYDEYHVCKRLHREVSCKLDYFKIHCCLTCHHYY